MYYKIKTIYPDIADDHFELRDNSDGKGPFIAGWDDPRPQPTPEELAVTDGSAAQLKAQNLSDLVATDKGMARVAEDVAVAMITNKPLPQASIDKINARRRLRGALDV